MEAPLFQPCCLLPQSLNPSKSLALIRGIHISASKQGFSVIDQQVAAYPCVSCALCRTGRRTKRRCLTSAWKADGARDGKPARIRRCGKLFVLQMLEVEVPVPCLMQACMIFFPHARENNDALLPPHHRIADRFVLSDG